MISIVIPGACNHSGGILSVSERPILTWKNQGLIKCSTQARVTALALFLGEPPETDPAALFGLIWGFATTFDRAFAALAAKTAAAEASK